MVNVAVFKSPFDMGKTQSIIADVLTTKGGSYKGNVGRWRAHDYKTVFPIKARFFYGKIQDGTYVRVVFDSAAFRRQWRSFICTLNEKYGDVFGLDADIHYKPVAVVSMKNEARRVYVNHTWAGSSLTGLLFGDAHAMSIGGGSEYETGLVDVEVVWSDGCIIKERISEKSDLYNQILMLNLAE